MAVRKIRTTPDPVLRQKARRVTSIDLSILRLIDDMIETLQATNHGVGLAAPQVGKSLRVVVIEMPEQEPFALINPEIVKKEGERVVDEGCLSIPGYHGEVKRSIMVKVKGKDRSGKEVRLKCDELLAQAMEHEIDHLDGILFPDRLVDPTHGLLQVDMDETAATAPDSP